MELQRAKGSPKGESFEFQVQEEGDWLVNVTNGDLFHQNTAASSAEINLDPYDELFKLGDFNKITPDIYTLIAIVRSQPGSYITIVISNKDFFSFPELP